MPVQAVKTVATARNGLGAFILQCKRLDLHYCDWAGSSRGMNKLLASAAASTSAQPRASPSTTSTSFTPQDTTPSTITTQPHHLLTLTQKYPSTEFRVSPRPHKHPTLKATYINGNIKSICVRNLTPREIVEKAELLLQNSGTKNKKIRGKNVVSSNEGVRGMWSALHGGIKAI